MMIESTDIGDEPVVIRGRVCGALAGAVLCMTAPTAAAQAGAAGFPSKPIRFIVPYPPAGTAGIQARAISDKLTEAWGQPVVIDHRPGGGGSIGAELAAKAPPDGYTIVMGTAQTHAINPSVFRKLPYMFRTRGARRRSRTCCRGRSR